MQNDNFFPQENYQVPSTSNYLKLTEGSHKFRVLSSAVVGFEYFNTNNKPVRSKVMFEDIPDDMKEDGRVLHFWSFCVWNYDAKRVQILEITQKSIMNQMKNYIDNPDWGNPKTYDITINRKGTTKNDTEYTVMPSPHKPIDKDIIDTYQKLNVKLDALFENKDPFATE